MESRKVNIPEQVKKDVNSEKDLGHGVTVLAINGEVAGLLSYQDELRPHARKSSPIQNSMASKSGTC